MMEKSKTDGHHREYIPRAALSASNPVMMRCIERYEYGPLACLDLGAGGIILQANPSAARMLGAESEALVGHAFRTFIAIKDHLRFAAFIDGVIAGDERAGCDLTLVGQAGSPMCDVYCMASTDAMRSTCYLMIMEAEAIRHDPVLPQAGPGQCALWTIRDLYYRTDADGRIQEISPSCLSLTGYAQHELLGRNVGAFYSDPGQRQALLEALQRDGHVDDFEISLQRKDGLTRIASVTSRMMLDPQQRPVGVEGILRDITERKLAEQEVRRNLESLSEVQRIASLGDCELDLATNSLSWSDETYRIFETSYHQFGATYEAFLASVHPDDREWVDNAYVMAIQKCAPIDIVHRLLFDDGRIKYVSAKGKVIADASGRPVRMRCTVQDITEQKRKEIDALEYWRKRDQLQHEQIAVQTAVALAHDLNQPLLAISAYCEASLKMLENAPIDRQRIADALSASVQQAMRAGETIRDMLAFLSRRDAPIEALDIGQHIHESVALFECDHEMPIHVRIELPEHMPRVRANDLQLHKALVCLIQNAAEAMAQADGRRAALEIQARHLKDEGMVEVAVRDNGPGLDKALAEAIFEPFFSTKVDGLGMGLTISRAMIESQGGRLWADPAAKGGLASASPCP